MADQSLETYMDQTAEVIGLPLSPEHRAGVLDNLTRAEAIMAPLLELELSEHTEAAPVFVP